ncbi:MAG: CDP-alcohol phosphatidyltransferase family protein [Proteobacteria bacterium]|nr:CDP-alcohol phosphatidyltransferase family protein [Pseudomonadota bacterium]
MDKNRIASNMISVVIGFRIIAAGILIYTIPSGKILLSVMIFLCAVATDALDGYLIRKSGVPASLGPYSDASADLILSLSCFIAFVITGIYPFWTIVVIIAMFTQFVLTPQLNEPIHDPIGQYYGVFLFGAIGITLILPFSFVYNLVLFGIIFFTVSTLISRVKFFHQLKKNQIQEGFSIQGNEQSEG